MNDIKFLKDIGLNEVARRTHIETEYLGYMVDKNFEKLARLNVKGFVKILEREFSIDFSQWMSEYEAFMNEHAGEVKQKTITISPKIPAYTADEKTSGSLFGIIILFALIGVLIYFFAPYKYLTNLSSFFDDKNKSVSYSDTAVVQQAARNLDLPQDTNVTISVSAPASQAQNDTEENSSNLAQETVMPQVEVASVQEKQEKEANETATKVAQNKKDKAAKAQEAVNLAEANATEQVQIPPKNDNVYDVSGLSEFKVVPRKKVWLGIINLDDKKKRSLDATKAVVIELGKKQLLVSGHGDIELEIDGKKIKFNGDNPKRFLVEKDKVTLIGYDEFVALNKGKSW